jgi:hypothetical protein
MSGAAQALLMRGGAPAALALSFLFSTGSTTTSHTVSASAQAGDLAILHCGANGSGSYSGATPAGWTQVCYSRTTSGTGAVWGVFAYKVLVSGDIGATLTGLPTGGGGASSTITYYRPSVAISSVSLMGGSSTGDEATTATPTNQTQNISLDNDPAYVNHVGWVANNSITTRGTTVTMSEITERASGFWSYVKYKIYNVGDTLEFNTASMADYGNNCLQSFVLKVK